MSYGFMCITAGPIEKWKLNVSVPRTERIMKIANRERNRKVTNRKSLS
uniref:Uncharacterized protein n=1 Tax=Arundo donax TaxID=35708 RepID=A0A0A8YA05_ARUDO